MKSRYTIFILIITCMARISFCENVLPKYFGKDKEQSKKCLLFSTNNISSDLDSIRDKIPASANVAEQDYVDNTLKKLKINCQPDYPKSFFERETINIKTLLGAPGPGDGIVNTFKDYGIIIIAGHGGSGGALAIENYHASNWEDTEDTSEILKVHEGMRGQVLAGCCPNLVFWNNLS